MKAIPLTLLFLGLAIGQPPAQNPPATSPPPTPPEPAAVPVPPAKGSATARSSPKTKRIELGGADATFKAGHAWEMDAVLPRTTKTGRTLVVSSSEIEPAALGNAEEDLSVMALILRKATGARTDDRRVAFGIEVDATVFGSSSGARNIYLEGYGAVFLLGVRFPLIAPADSPDDKEPKENVSNEWADAREEFLGGDQPQFQVAFDAITRLSNRLPVEDYDADKVEDLKTGLLQALKNAAHIRVLKPSDYVTVVIQGGDSARPERAALKPGSRARSASRPNETVMTLRVHKADVDAFARGALDLEAFRKKASVQVYARRGDSSVGTAGFIAPKKQ